MRNKGLILIPLCLSTALLAGCSSDPQTDTILDNKADYSINISLPYATVAPDTDESENVQALVIDEDGNVTVNDSSAVLDIQPVSSDSDESNYKTLSLGTTGLAVQALQMRLSELGYYTEDVSGIFDEETESAVRRFEQTYGTMQTGVATARLQARLFSSSAPAYGSDEYNDAVVSQYTILQRGDVGSAVYALQNRLKNLGYPITELTGVFDDETANAVMLFYEAYGIAPDDSANVALQKELYADSARTYEGRAVVDEDAASMNTAEIFDIQSRLIELGYMSGTPGGMLDSATLTAAKLFAEACGQLPTETINEALIEKLESDSAPAYAQLGSRYSNLIEGASGENVRLLQARLVALGYASGTPDGTYGPTTTESVRLFQNYNEMEETGTATAYVQAVLYSTFAVNIDGEASVNLLYPDEGESEEAMKMGLTGGAVLRLQARLTELGYFVVENGLYDNLTAQAVAQLQANAGIDETGIADAELLTFIYSKVAPEKDKPFAIREGGLGTLTLNDTGDEVTRLQKRLWEAGLLAADDVADSIGTFNEATAEAVRAVQKFMGYTDCDGVASPAVQSYLYSEYIVAADEEESVEEE